MTKEQGNELYKNWINRTKVTVNGIEYVSLKLLVEMVCYRLEDLKKDYEGDDTYGEIADVIDECIKTIMIFGGIKP